jgi:hypothetical protein
MSTGESGAIGMDFVGNEAAAGHKKQSAISIQHSEVRDHAVRDHKASLVYGKKLSRKSKERRRGALDN